MLISSFELRASFLSKKNSLYSKELLSISFLKVKIMLISSFGLRAFFLSKESRSDLIQSDPT